MHLLYLLVSLLLVKYWNRIYSSAALMIVFWTYYIYYIYMGLRLDYLIKNVQKNKHPRDFSGLNTLIEKKLWYS